MLPLRAALRELLQQIDIGDYRDRQGRPRTRRAMTDEGNFWAVGAASAALRFPGGIQEAVMQTEPNTPAPAGRDHLLHEQQLAAALRELLQQIDIGDYRDRQGRPARESPAYRAAQALDERLRLTHDPLVAASPSDVPAEYNTWHTGP